MVKNVSKTQERERERERERTPRDRHVAARPLHTHIHTYTHTRGASHRPLHSPGVVGSSVGRGDGTKVGGRV